jgi:DNA-binding transcriptional LysR family regulator
MGTALMPHAEAMESAALAAHDQLSGNQVEIRGVVRLGVPEVLGVRVIAPLLARFLQEHPELSIDLLVQPRFANLANREADLGVTLDAPATGRYMVTRMASFRLSLYASPDYLARHAPIRSKADLAGHDFVDYVQDRLASNELNFLDELGCVPRRRLCCTGMMAQAEAARAGLGLMMAPPYVIPEDGSLVPVLANEVFADRAYYLVAPVDLYRLPRVRAVWSLLREYADAQPELFSAGEEAPPVRRKVARVK